jgi:hypothetical protein
METRNFCGHSGYDVKKNKGLQKMNILKGCFIAAVLFAMAAAPATAAPIGSAGYYVETLSSSFVTSSFLTAQANYNFGNIPGAKFPPISVDPNYTGSQEGTLDMTGLATSSFDQTAGLWHPNPVSCTGCPDQSAASFAKADLATGSLQASGLGVGFSRGAGEAIMLDTLHFTIAGATGSTITPITVHWTLEGTWSYDPISWLGRVYAILALNGRSGAFVEVSMQGSSNPLVPLDFHGSLNGQSGWASFSYASRTITRIDFTGVYNLVGASVDLQISSNLTVDAQGGLSADIKTAYPTSINFGNTGKVALILPNGVSFTSASGVFPGSIKPVLYLPLILSN